MELKSFNVTHRLLHWNIAICIIILLVTALLHITWFGRDNLVKIIQENLLLLCGIQLSLGDASIIAKRIAQPMWEWHFYAGYALMFFYILRFIHLTIYGMFYPNPFKINTPLKQKVQGFTYLLF